MIFHGNYLNVNIYPVFSAKSPKGCRKRKANPTSEIQQQLNERYAKEKIVFLLNNNFTENDYAVHLTYDKQHLPQDFEAAAHEEDKFIRRLRRALKKLRIELKYYSALEEGSKSGRLHHHIIMSGGLPIGDIAKLWGNGYIQVKPLQFNETGITDLGYYISKETKGRKRLKHTRNLKMPTERKRDGRISRKKLNDIVNFNVDVNDFCRNTYIGYELADMERVYNDVNGNYYVTFRLYKPDVLYKRKGR